MHLYGVDMAQDSVLETEYSYQRPSCEYLLGIAVGRGIKVETAPGSDLLKADRLYGFDSNQLRVRMMARRRTLQKKVDELETEVRKSQDLIQRSVGGVNALEWLLHNVLKEDASVADIRMAIATQMKPEARFIEEQQSILRDLERRCNVFRGALDDTEGYLRNWTSAGWNGAMIEDDIEALLAQPGTLDSELQVFH